nr:MAG TPA: hypothetical protein [Caudoviricetes sp.]
MKFSCPPSLTRRRAFLFSCVQRRGHQLHQRARRVRADQRLHPQVHLCEPAALDLQRRVAVSRSLRRVQQRPQGFHRYCAGLCHRAGLHPVHALFLHALFLLCSAGAFRLFSFRPAALGRHAGPQQPLPPAPSDEPRHGDPQLVRDLRIRQALVPQAACLLRVEGDRPSALFLRGAASAPAAVSSSLISLRLHTFRSARTPI